MAGGRLPDNVFFVDTDAKLFKGGMTLRPLVVCERGLLFSRRCRYYGFRHYLSDGRVWASLMSLGRSGVLSLERSGGMWVECAREIGFTGESDGGFEEVRFDDIRGFSLRRLISGDHVVEIFYRQGPHMGDLSFFAANPYMSMPAETDRLYHLIRDGLASLRH
jgi:hypothetical protein